MKLLMVILNLGEKMVLYKLLWPTHGKLIIYLIILLCWSSVIIVVDGQKTDPVEVKALRSVWKSLIDPFHNLARWNKGDPCTSNWNGVICNNGTLEDGHLHVRELLFLSSNLSGSLSPELGRMSHLMILDFMWNNITGSIPREIGNITTLQLLLLNGNQLTGSLPDELGNLFNLDRLQIDENQISGPIPSSFAKLTKVKHIHMNNNSLNGQIPPELSQLPLLVHLLLDSNNLSGYLPPELSEIPVLQILQLDNNNFGGSRIPSSYGNMSHLLKLSLRNCSLRGPIPDWSRMTNIAYLDLSLNQLSGYIPSGALGENITTIDLSYNSLYGTIPASFTSLPHFQKLSVANNTLSGSIRSIIWLSRTLASTERLFLEFGNNMFLNIIGSVFVPPNVTIGLSQLNDCFGLLGNPLCLHTNLVQLCGSHVEEFHDSLTAIATPNNCPPQSCPHPYEYAPATCYCAAPLFVGYRLKSPGFSDFLPYVDYFMHFLGSGLQLNFSQIDIDSVAWERGPRLRMSLKIFPTYVNYSSVFEWSDVLRIRDLFSSWTIPRSPLFGPYELLDFIIPEQAYPQEYPPTKRDGMSKGVLVGIVLGVMAGTVMICSIVVLLVLRLNIRKHHSASKRCQSSRASVKIDGVKDFTYDEMALATDNFSIRSMVGQGGYGKVYRGILADGMVVAIKRAQTGSIQGETEFLTEIKLLSRLHHRNLVSLIGYCDEEGEQMLIYEFMPNGTLRDHLSGGKSKKVSPSFSMRVRIALGSSRGILYLHTEADPPIFHRDIKASNILLDAKLTAKVADFGLSKLAPAPELEGDLPSHVSTVVKGTPGYLDPEYFATHKLTDKSDVYSLGVVFLELLTGMHPISNGKNIVREVSNACRSDMLFSIVDDQMGSYPSECVEKFMSLALKCCQNNTDARPSMAQIVRELENIWLMMPESDTKITDLYPGNVMTPPSSSTSSKNPFFSQDLYPHPSHDLYPHPSQDLSGSELVSGVIHKVEPR